MAFALMPAPFQGRHSLHQLYKPLPQRHDVPGFTLGVTLPKAGHVRVRRLIHRGAPRPVTKFPSIKLERAVHCESALEVEAATVLDACPQVRWFGEQPLVLHFQQDDYQRSHVPDFIVATHDRQEIVEVKFQRDIDSHVLERTALLQQLLKPYGYCYRLISELEIRHGHALGNSKSLLLRGREVAPSMWALQIYEDVRRHGSLPLALFGWDRPGQAEAGWIAREIIDGRLRVDLTKPLSSDSMVCAASASQLEGQLWLPAASI